MVMQSVSYKSQKLEGHSVESAAYIEVILTLNSSVGVSLWGSVLFYIRIGSYASS
jgi:hypothetical protein